VGEEWFNATFSLNRCRNNAPSLQSRISPRTRAVGSGTRGEARHWTMQIGVQLQNLDQVSVQRGGTLSEAWLAWRAALCGEANSNKKIETLLSLSSATLQTHQLPLGQELHQLLSHQNIHHFRYPSQFVPSLHS